MVGFDKILGLFRKEVRAPVIVVAVALTLLYLLLWGPAWATQAKVDSRQDNHVINIHDDMRALFKALKVEHPRHGEHDP